MLSVFWCGVSNGVEATLREGFVGDIEMSRIGFDVADAHLDETLLVNAAGVVGLNLQDHAHLILISGKSAIHVASPGERETSDHGYSCLAVDTDVLNLDEVDNVTTRADRCGDVVHLALHDGSGHRETVVIGLWFLWVLVVHFFFLMRSAETRVARASLVMGTSLVVGTSTAWPQPDLVILCCPEVSMICVSSIEEEDSFLLCCARNDLHNEGGKRQVGCKISGER